MEHVTRDDLLNLGNLKVGEGKDVRFSEDARIHLQGTDALPEFKAKDLKPIDASETPAFMEKSRGGGGASTRIARPRFATGSYIGHYKQPWTFKKMPEPYSEKSEDLLLGYQYNHWRKGLHQIDERVQPHKIPDLTVRKDPNVQESTKALSGKAALQEQRREEIHGTKKAAVETKSDQTVVMGYSRHGRNAFGIRGFEQRQKQLDDFRQEVVEITPCHIGDKVATLNTGPSTGHFNPHHNEGAPF